MNTEFDTYLDELQGKIQETYQRGVNLEQAEHFASELLGALLTVSKELAKADLDARMRKSGVKAIRSAVYLDEVQKADKKPSDTMLAAIVDSNDIVKGEQQRFDESEVQKAELDRIFSVLQNAHIHYRTIAKGAFSG